MFSLILFGIVHCAYRPKDGFQEQKKQLTFAIAVALVCQSFRCFEKSLRGNLVQIEDGPAAVTGNRFHVLPLGESPGKVWKMDDPEVRRPAWNDGICNPVDKDAFIDTRKNRDSPDQDYDSGIFLFSGSEHFFKRRITHVANCI
jgi:hypothetical protein